MYTYESLAEMLKHLDPENDESHRKMYIKLNKMLLELERKGARPSRSARNKGDKI